MFSLQSQSKLLKSNSQKIVLHKAVLGDGRMGKR